MTQVTTQQPSALSRWARRLALFGVQLIVLAIVLHRFVGLPSPALIGTFQAVMALGFAAIVLALVSLRTIWRNGGSGVGAALLGSLFGLGLLAWPAALLPFLSRTPAIADISTDTQAAPQFRELAKLRQPGLNTVAYAGEITAKIQAEAFPDIRTMVVTRPGQESFDLTREIIRRMKWVEVASRPPANATAVAEIEAQVKTPVLGFRDDVVIRLQGERTRTRIDIRSASTYGTHDFGRNAERVRALMQELHIRLDLGVPLEPEVVAKRRRVRQKLLQQARGQVTAGQPGSPAGQSQPFAGRERAQKPSPRSPDENRAPGKQRRQSWE